MDSTHLAIMALDAYVINSNDLYELRQKYKRNTFEHLLPYTINLKEYNDAAKNNIIPSEYYLQFTGQIKEEIIQEYTLFNLSTLDEVLGEEIGCAGVEDLFQAVNFKKILSKFPIVTYTEKGVWLRAPHYLMVQMDYFSSYDHYSGATEYDLVVDIIGYLDTNLEKHIFDVLNIDK